MGADLLMSWVTWDKDITLNWEEGKRLLKEKDLEINKTEQEDVDLDDVVINSQDESTYGELLIAMEDVENAIKDPDRFTYIMTLGSINMLLSGGVSYGEDPCATFTQIYRLQKLPPEVAKAIGFHVSSIPDYRDWLLKTLKLHPEILPTLIGIDPEFDEILEPRLKEV